MINFPTLNFGTKQTQHPKREEISARKKTTKINWFHPENVCLLPLLWKPINTRKEHKFQFEIVIEKKLFMISWIYRITLERKLSFFSLFDFFFLGFLCLRKCFYFHCHVAFCDLPKFSVKDKHPFSRLFSLAFLFSF